MSSKLSATIVDSQSLQTQRRGGQLCDPATMSFDVGDATRTCVKGSSEVSIPKDKSILFVEGGRKDLSFESARNVREDWRDGIRDPKDCEGKLSKSVESWCIHCTENTKLSGGRTRCVDESPRWTLGDPPKYVERRPACLNCLSEGRPRGARFVPVDVTIPSIYKKRISTFEENFGSLEEDTKAEALAVEPKSSKKPRTSKTIQSKSSS